jgi:cytoskeleton protein RodZ
MVQTTANQTSGDPLKNEGATQQTEIRQQGFTRHNIFFTPDDQPPSSEGVSSETVLKKIGKILQTERRQQGLTRQEISSQLRIAERYLKNIEIGNADELPAMAYVIGYVRTYANFLKLDAASLCAELKISLSAKESRPQYEFINQKFQHKSTAGRTALAALVAGVVFYGGWYAMTTSPSDPAIGTTADQVPEVQFDTVANIEIDTAAGVTGENANKDVLTPNVETGNETVIADAQPAVTEVLPETSTLPDAEKQQGTVDVASAAAPTATPAAIPVATDDLPKVDAGGVETTVTETASVATPILSDGDNSVTAAIATNRIPEKEITVLATANSWVEVTRADGSVVSQRLMRKGETYIVPGGEDLFLTTGNAGGLEIKLGLSDAVTLGGWGETLSELPLDHTIISQRY